MLSRKIILKLGLVIGISTFLVGNYHKQVKIKKNYQNYINQRFDKDLKNRQKQVQETFVKPMVENMRREELEKIQKQQEIEMQRLVNLSRGRSVEEEIFILTFYSDSNSENGYGSITCQGRKLRDGICANNVLPLGTVIKLESYGQLVIADRGGSNFNTSDRLDVFISREDGENESQYLRRVDKMGIIKVKGYIVK